MSCAPTGLVEALQRFENRVIELEKSRKGDNDKIKELENRLDEMVKSRINGSWKKPSESYWTVRVKVEHDVFKVEWRSGRRDEFLFDGTDGNVARVEGNGIVASRLEDGEEQYRRKWFFDGNLLVSECRFSDVQYIELVRE